MQNNQHPDHTYLDLVDMIIGEGEIRGDRTGTGTYSLFGPQMEFDLLKGFPLLTTKHVNWNNIWTELFWFLKGDTNTKFLKGEGNNIWNAWADEDGNLGPVYGAQWRNWGGAPESMTQPTPQLREGVEATYLNAGNGKGKSSDALLGKLWEGMMSRCYNKNHPQYHNYGGKGVHVCDEWLEFKVFAKDAMLLPGWDDKKRSPKKYQLDKDIRGNGFRYGPNHAIWVSTRINNEASSITHETVVERISDSKQFKFTNITEFCELMGAEPKNFSDLWTGNKNAKQRSGFKLVSRKPLKSGVDQINELIDNLRNNPFSRRHIVSGWNPALLPDESATHKDNVKNGKQALPPCHTMFQFYVSTLTVEQRIAYAKNHMGVEDADDLSKAPADEVMAFLTEEGVPLQGLSCKLYQRSADMFLGVPYNIASYAALNNLLATMLGMAPVRFIHTFGDAHVYLNHTDQLAEQMSPERVAKDLPYLDVHDRVRGYISIDELRLDDVKLVGYDSHPAISSKGLISI